MIPSFLADAYHHIYIPSSYNMTYILLIRWYISIEEFVVDESVLTDVPLYEKADQKGKNLFEDECQEKWKVEVFGGHVENVDEVNEVEQEYELVTQDHHVREA